MKEFIFLILILSPIFLLITVTTFLKSSSFKGMRGEACINKLISKSLDKKVYHLLKNVTLAIDKQHTTQIDHLVISPFGIFVIETKNMQGVIIGARDDKQWMQKIHQQYYPFQNPLHQNYKHLKALEILLNVRLNQLHSIVVFSGKSKFAAPMPRHVIQKKQLISLIQQEQTLCFSPAEVTTLLDKIATLRLTPSLKTHKAHVKQLATINAEKALTMTCPCCQQPMVLRVTQQGKSQGKPFWGCSQFPTCKTVVNIS
ncbi:nuclease-related protein/topoisomerase C4 zinc finger-containing protein [Beggiatoa alba B18LD]|uniref:Nuclease-related protein/topoisomerase C4 zinc finger-containing protein n=1 Tax=Beggiatoa alba B18LD TaxID=395493 RepID=I3CKL0_9GAMM|nr:NERD domain-containing protein [Beggiatoa alba]EIJ44153.1 nuclease-related protein/topoisomerase C4 zinc finger-containing protein [Beggiatoa alba B18LD]